MKTVFRWTYLTLALLVTSPAIAQVKVVTTLPDYGALVRVIGGAQVEVRVLASATEDPHYVDPKPSYILALNQADLLVMNGGELEIGWLPRLLVQARNPKIQPGQTGYLKVANHITDMLDVPPGKVDRSMGDIHSGGNPHYYYDPVRMNGLLPIIAQRLSSLDPNHKEIYGQNLAKAQAQFSEHITRWKAEFTALTASQRRVISYHKSLNYFFQTVGIEVIAYLEPKPGVAPTPSHVAQVLGVMKRDKIRAIVQEQYYPSATSKTLARLVSGRVVLLTAGTKPDQTYLAHIQEIITPLLAALKGDQ